MTLKVLWVINNKYKGAEKKIPQDRAKKSQARFSVDKYLVKCLKKTEFFHKMASIVSPELTIDD